MPPQLALELHLPAPREDAAEEALAFFAALARVGYVLVSREDNPRDALVSEFTLVRAFCEA